MYHLKIIFGKRSKVFDKPAFIKIDYPICHIILKILENFGKYLKRKFAFCKIVVKTRLLNHYIISLGIYLENFVKIDKMLTF